MNPGEGHEKGNVENKVGYHRRNFLVPMPRFLSLSDFNRQLLEMCDNDADRSITAITRHSRNSLLKI